MESLGAWDAPAPPLPTPASHPREPDPAASSPMGSQAVFFLPGYAARSRVGAMRSFLFQEQVKEIKQVPQFLPLAAGTVTWGCLRLAASGTDGVCQLLWGLYCLKPPGELVHCCSRCCVQGASPVPRDAWSTQVSDHGDAWCCSAPRAGSSPCLWTSST